MGTSVEDGWRECSSNAATRTSITGHTTDSVYQRYFVVKDEDQRAALARVETGFRNPAQISLNGACAPSGASAK